MNSKNWTKQTRSELLWSFKWNLSSEYENKSNTQTPHDWCQKSFVFYQGNMTKIQLSSSVHPSSLFWITNDELEGLFWKQGEFLQNEALHFFMLLLYQQRRYIHYRLETAGFIPPLLSSSVTEVSVCPAGTGWVYWRGCQILKRGFWGSAQQTALLGLRKSLQSSKLLKWYIAWPSWHLL